MTSTQHLRDLRPGPDSISHSERSVARIILCGLPEDARKQFFPNASIDEEEKQILSRNEFFVRAGAVHHLVQRFAAQPKVREAIKNQMRTQKAALFWSAVTAIQPPPTGQDPVVAYGWDRSRDGDMLKRYQEQCANVMLSCNRLGFVRGTPEIRQYLDNNPAEWYEKLAKHVTSAAYKTQFALEVVGGVHNIQILLVNLFSKLVLLREAARCDLQPAPEKIVMELCKKVAHDAIDIAQCDDDTKSRVRQLIETIAEIGSKGPETELAMNMTIKFQGYVDFDDMEGILKEELKRDSNFFERVLLIIIAAIMQTLPFKLVGMWLKAIMEKRAINEINDRVKEFLEAHASAYGLY